MESKKDKDFRNFVSFNFQMLYRLILKTYSKIFHLFKWCREKYYRFPFNTRWKVSFQEPIFTTSRSVLKRGSINFVQTDKKHLINYILIISNQENSQQNSSQMEKAISKHSVDCLPSRIRSFSPQIVRVLEESFWISRS